MVNGYFHKIIVLYEINNNIMACSRKTEISILFNLLKKCRKQKSIISTSDFVITLLNPLKSNPKHNTKNKQLLIKIFIFNPSKSVSKQ